MPDGASQVVGLCDSGDFYEAKAVADRLMRERPGDAMPVVLSALAHAHLGDGDAAHRLVRRAADLGLAADEVATALVNRVITVLGDHAMALEYGRRAVKSAPEEARAVWLPARRRHLLGR